MGKYNSKPKKDRASKDATSDEKFQSKSKDSRKPRGGGKRWDKASKSEGRNDISWYTPDPQLVLDAGRWPYSRPVGTPLSRNSMLHIADGSDDAVPGILVAESINTIGRCNVGADAPNVAANAVYTFVRHQNSGSRNYESNDLMLYIMALDSIYTAVSWITRVYATVGMYSDMNKYLPEALAYAQNVDLDSIRSNMANFRAEVNSLILKIGALVVPDTMPIFKRHSWIYQNYYSEGDNIKDQIYLYTPMNFYVFQLDSSGAGMLKNKHVSDYYVGGKMTAQSFVRLLNDMITPIFNDEDFNIMAGDILKAYGDSILRLMLIPDLLIAQPINNFEVLQQFKNSTAFPMDANTLTGNFDIVQDANKEFLINTINDFAFFRHIAGARMPDSSKLTKPDEYRIAYDELTRPKILTSESMDVSPAENMINTRLVSLPEMEPTTDTVGIGIRDYTFGTEILANYRYIFHDKNWVIRERTGNTVMTYDSTSVSDLDQLNQLQTVMSSFRFHPAHAFLGYDNSTSPATYIPSALPNFGIDNFTTIDYDHIDTLNQVAILGEFNVPRLAVIK